MKHDYYEIPEGLTGCHTCKSAEGDLTKTDCPGSPLSFKRSLQVWQEGWDFKDGCWIAPLPKRKVA